MHQQGLQLIIRQKLQNGTLPNNSIPRVWGGPGNGEACDACDGIVTKDEWVIEGIALAGAGHRSSCTPSALTSGSVERLMRPVESTLQP